MFNYILSLYCPKLHNYGPPGSAKNSYSENITEKMTFGKYFEISETSTGCQRLIHLENFLASEFFVPLHPPRVSENVDFSGFSTLFIIKKSCVFELIFHSYYWP
jgi:hypothetical protein